MKEIYVFVKIFAYITEKEGGKSLEVREASSLHLKTYHLQAGHSIVRFLQLAKIKNQHDKKSIIVVI